MNLSKKPVFILLLIVTVSLSYACIGHAAKNVGSYWSSFDSRDGLGSDISSEYVVVDAADARNGNIAPEFAGIGPFRGNGPSFSDPGVVLYEDDGTPQVALQEPEIPVVWREVKVETGDTLSKIAEKYGVTIKEIMQANELADEHKLREGQVLYIPNSSEYILETLAHVRKLKNDELARKKQAEPVRITNYIVKNGDTLWSIANAFDLDVNSIFGCNNKISETSVLKIGATIRVPNQDGILITVKSGQTLEQLAKAYGIFAEAILSANEMTDPKQLVQGSEIFLPGAKVSAPAETGGKRSTGNQGGATLTAQRGFGWPVVGKISSPFGWRRDPVKGGRDFHTGLDIRAPRGRPIVAAAAGKVVHSGWMGGYGKTVVVSHPGGTTTLYAHCSSLLVKSGTNVKRGQRIALVGSTGRSTGNHLHFEVRKSGTPMNPIKYLR